MMEFGRQYVLQIGEDDDAIIINNLRIAFSFSHTHDKTSNTGTITIYNLSRNTVNNILKGYKDHRYQQVTLSVGYGDLNDVRLLFKGQLTNTVANKAGATGQVSNPAASGGNTSSSQSSKANSSSNVDSTLVLTCDDGGTAPRDAVVNTSLVAGSRHSDIIKVCAATMPGILPGLLGIANDVILPRGRVCYGMTRHLLTQIASHHDADWSIQHGYLMLLQCDYVRPDPAIVLSQMTGMIGAPKKVKDGYEVTCLLRPEIMIGSLVRLDSMNDSYDGEYKVVGIKSDGDTHSALWKSTVELKNVSTTNNGKFLPASSPKAKGGKA